MHVNYKNITKKEAIETYLKVLNAIQPDVNKVMADTEIKVLAEFLVLPRKFEYFRFSTKGKQRVSKALAESGYRVSRATLNGKLYSLERKGILSKDEDGVVYLAKHISEVIKKIRDKDKYHIIIELNSKDEEASISENSSTTL